MREYKFLYAVGTNAEDYRLVWHREEEEHEHSEIHTKVIGGDQRL